MVGTLCMQCMLCPLGRLAVRLAGWQRPQGTGSTTLQKLRLRASRRGAGSLFCSLHHSRLPAARQAPTELCVCVCVCAVIAEEDRVMPSRSAVHSAGRYDLHHAIMSHGGYLETGQELDRRPSWPPSQHLDR